MDTPQKQDDQNQPPQHCGICGSDDIGVYGPFEGYGLNAECHRCGAQWWSRATDPIGQRGRADGWIDQEEL